MYIIWRQVCETFSRIAVKRSFLWGHKHAAYAAASFSANVTSWCSGNDTQIFASGILYINIIFITEWLSAGNSEILRGSDVLARCQKLCKPKSIFMQTRVNFFLPRTYDVISQLCHSYVMGIFCMTPLNYIDSLLRRLH